MDRNTVQYSNRTAFLLPKVHQSHSALSRLLQINTFLVSSLSRPASDSCHVSCAPIHYGTMYVTCTFVRRVALLFPHHPQLYSPLANSSLPPYVSR